MSLFGTDGIRGLANGQVLTAELALDVAVAAAHILVESFDDKSERPRAIVGQDSRASGEFLEAAVVAGLTSAGVDVYRVGVLPTPAISYLVASTGADLGVMISASHNAMPDNGIKLFARGGGKLDDSIEALVEARIGEPWERPTGRGVGRAINDAGAKEKYIEHLLTSLTTRLDRLKIVVDCANGAASFVAPDLLARAGATVIAISHTPDGWNINDNCGSTYLANLKAAVVKEGADFGIAHDGDADRCLAVDAQGNEVDGDMIMAILAIGMKAQGELKADTIVGTVMSRFPQILINVKGVAKNKLASNSAIADAVKVAEATLGSSGRVLLRASGTENLVRVMVEASSDNLASDVATTLADVVRKELSL